MRQSYTSTGPSSVEAVHRLVPSPRPRSNLRAVAVPVEHGGWGLTAEPVLLGLLVRPSVAGLCIGLVAILAFVARTPLKVLLVDTHRGRRLPRTRTAAWVLATECALLVALVVAAASRAEGGSWWPLLVVVPLLCLELWFDMRSRGRRLVPELSGAVGIAGVAAVIVQAGGGGALVALAAWTILVARAVTAIVTVRDQVGHLHGRPAHLRLVLGADLTAASLATVAVALEPSAVVGAIAVLIAIGIQRVLGLRPTPRPVILGLRQTALGLAIVVATAVGLLSG